MRTQEQIDLTNRWIEVLRSGEVKQTQARLMRVGKDGPSFCCLGVLTVLAAARQDVDVPIEMTLEDCPLSCAGNVHIMGRRDFHRLTGLPAGLVADLVSRNDDGNSFADLAAMIEQAAEFQEQY